MHVSRQAVIWLIKPWQPMVAFAAAAIVYAAMHWLMGRHIAYSAQAAAMLSLFISTPLAASICRRIASPFNRFFAATVGALAGAAAWIVLATLSFHWGDGRRSDPSLAKIIQVGLPAALLYLPLTWLVGGAGHGQSREHLFRHSRESGNPVSLRGDHSGTRSVNTTADETRLNEGNALGASALWLLVAGAIAVYPRIALFEATASWWGPYSIFIAPVAGIVCVLNAVRAAGAATIVARWSLRVIAAVLAIRLLDFLWFTLFASGFMH